ncbi:uncharacterized protein LOC119105383 [Pollicipes pollicipes]|uniref:uncharacterized protein LOC119105383 n=1 Tax=Pollicipes pollicipes TaxID=41117 RepID=UPI001884A04B|nr:uncharacterized protein LOC119105383 [Pollicipes pollicipes]
MRLIYDATLRLIGRHLRRLSGQRLVDVCLPQPAGAPSQPIAENGGETETENLLSCQQKGFRSYDGVLEHNFILQSAITAQRRQPGGQLHVCFIDLANAFGSLPHRYLWSGLARLGLPGEVLFTLEDLYDGSTTMYTTAQGTSEPAPVTRGVRHDCPLSGILFNLGMEPLVRALDAVDRVTTLAFADDLTLRCRDAEALDTALTTLEEVCSWCGLAPNARKSGLLSVGSPSPQKLDALRASILPRLTHCLRLGLLPKQALRQFDTELRWRVKGALQLPSRACQEHLHASTSRGCVGLTELASEADILLLASTWQILTSPDELVRETAASQLKESAAALLREAVRQAAAERLYRLPHQGKVMQTVGDQRVSSHYMYSGSFTRLADWRFVHRARLGLVPLNGVRRSPVRGDERCRRCGYARETLPHVLCHCMPHSAAFQRRQSAILSRLHKAVQRDGVVTQINRRVPGCASTLRPDLVVTRGDEVILADVTVAFENGPDALRAASDAKVRKYTPLVHELRGRGKTASVVASIVGPLGTWWRGNEASLRRHPVSQNYAKLMRRLMVSDTLRWSRDIYIKHLSGHRQYE